MKAYDKLNKIEKKYINLQVVFLKNYKSLL